MSAAEPSHSNIAVNGSALRFKLAEMGHGRGEIRALTSLRGVAAMAIVLQHFSATFEAHSTGWMPSLVPHGYMAVDFFFVLSGFIMAYTYLADFQSRGFAAFQPFVASRIARIAPLNLAVTALILTLGAIASLWGRSDLFINAKAVDVGLAQAIAVNVLHLQGFLTEYNLNVPSWSISIELFAYLAFPVLIVIIEKRSLYSLLYVLAGMAFLTLAAVTQPRLGLNMRSPPFDLARCLAEFGFGMVAYRLFRDAPSLRFLGRDRWTLAITALSLGLFVLRLDLLIALSFPLLVLSWAGNTGAASRAMSSGIPYFMGKISFSLYLTHQLYRRPALEAVRSIWPDPMSPAAACILALAASLLVIPVASLAYYGVEQPGRLKLRALFQKRPRLSAAPVG